MIGIKPDEKPLGARRRDLMLRVMDGQSDLSAPLYNVYCHVRCDDVLQWLIKNGKTGEEFRVTLRERFANSTLLMIQHIVKELNRDLALKPILAGRDLKLALT